MRLSTIAGIAVLTIATAAMAQVARLPVEQKNATANSSANTTATSGPMSNDAMANMVSGNDTGTPPDTKTEPATPRR